VEDCLVECVVEGKGLEGSVIVWWCRGEAAVRGWRKALEGGEE
jgi:hypothetical protein